MRSLIPPERGPYCKEHRKHTSASFRLILLIACAKLGVVTLLLLLCVINKKSYGMEGLKSISRLKGKLNKEKRGTGHRDKLGAAWTLLLVAAAL